MVLQENNLLFNDKTGCNTVIYRNMEVVLFSPIPSAKKAEVLTFLKSNGMTKWAIMTTDNQHITSKGAFSSLLSFAAPLANNTLHQFCTDHWIQS